MLEMVQILKQVRVAFDPRFPIEGKVIGVEREEDDRVFAVLIASPLVEGGTIYFLAEDLTYADVTLADGSPASLPN